MIIYFVQTHDTIKRYVHEETSYIAERTFRENTQGEAIEMLDELVMDEEYDHLFRRLFAEAKSDVIYSISPIYLAETPTDLSSVFLEYHDFRADRDFSLWLDVPTTFPMQYKKTIDTKIQQYIIYYIMWKWLDTKMPEIAVTYKIDIDRLKLEINNLLRRRMNIPTKRPSFP